MIINPAEVISFENQSHFGIIAQKESDLCMYQYVPYAFFLYLNSSNVVA